MQKFELNSGKNTLQTEVPFSNSNVVQGLSVPH